ncbi:MAG: DUF6351 family protein [Acidobacteriota bacterium]|nr:DUF6351 family protein [Acidobacteriota bacterium]
MAPHARPVRRVVGGALVLLLSGCVDQGVVPAMLDVSTVPTPAHLVSGGEALVRVLVPEGVDPNDAEVRLAGRDVTQMFRELPPDRLQRPRRVLLGLVTGLEEGANDLHVRLGSAEAALTLTNYPIHGPIFSGDHLDPYFCLGDLAPGAAGEARRFAIGNGDVLEGTSQQEHCALETRVDVVYRTTGDEPRFEPWPADGTTPADVADATTTEGQIVPYVVRLETGTINRAIYQTAALIDPDAPAPTPWTPPSGWNGRLVYTYGGGCEAGFFQGTSTGGVLRDNMLSLGYGVASSTLNVNAQGGCNDVLSAETTMMVKERFAEVYGPPLHTIGWGGSGGAMQQLLIAGAYPGILDGILPTLTFPDAISYFIDTAECRLPLRRFLNAQDPSLSDEVKNAVGGWAAWEVCDRSLGPRPNRIGPDDCPGPIPAEARYHPVDNPDGVRCSIYDGMRNVFGTRPYDEIEPAPRQPFGRNPQDNVGVQYGLEALNAGLIDTSLFLDLNEQAGGWDIDFRWRPERAEGDADAIRIAYETGRITSGGGGLAITPVIDERNYLDHVANFHASYYSFVMRERLIRDNGHADNYVIQRRMAPLSRADESLALMDEWLVAMALDEGPSGAEKMVRAKPAALQDSCWSDDGLEIVEPAVFDREAIFDNTKGRCNELFPPHAGARIVAGGPLTNDVLKCQLKPIDPADYGVTLTAEEMGQLEAIFPKGVCDWSKQGMGQVPNTRTWLSYGPSPVNRYQ